MILKSESDRGVPSCDHSTESLNKTQANEKQRLLSLIDILPEDWGLVAVGSNKAPIGKDWQKKPLKKADFEEALRPEGCFSNLFCVSKNKQIFHPPGDWCKAVGVLCGEQSGGLLFVDHDGHSCDSLIESLSGQPIGEALPKTVGVTSGRQGRYQLIYSVPKRFWEKINTYIEKTGTIGEDKKAEQLEFRWHGCQSVVLGWHPITGSYYWLPGQSPAECEVVDVPEWAIERMTRGVSHKSEMVKQQENNWTDADRARSYLVFLPNSDLDWETWRNILFGLHKAGVSESEVRAWSRSSTKHTDEGFNNVWTYIDDIGACIGLGTLCFYAKQNGWHSPEKNQEQHSLSTLETEDFTEEVRALVNHSQENFDIRRLLPTTLASSFINFASRLNIPPVALVATILPVASSLLRVNTRIEIDSATDFKPPAILWFGLVAESGTAKSTILNTVLKPLERLQLEADSEHQLEYDRYSQELADWEKASKEATGTKPKPPIVREFYFQDVTIEALAASIARQPERGVLLAVDELAGLIKSLDQYKSSGRGSDRQKLLSAYNGGAIKVNRKGGGRESNRLSIPYTAISLVGTIQPTVLQSLMGNLEDVDGLWPRWAWVRLPPTIMPPPGDGGKFELGEMLYCLYQKLASFEAVTYCLDKEGRTIWRQFHLQTEEQRLTEHHPSLRAIFPKARERAARIALVLHCIDPAFRAETPNRTIPATTLSAAIALTQWLIQQARLIYAEAGLVQEEYSRLILRLVEHFRNRDWVSATDIRKWYPARKKPNVEACRKLMKTVVALGYAVDNGSSDPKKLAIRVIKTGSQSGQFCHQSQEHPVAEGIHFRSPPVVGFSQLDKDIELPSKQEIREWIERSTTSDDSATTESTTEPTTLEPSHQGTLEAIGTEMTAINSDPTTADKPLIRDGSIELGVQVRKCDKNGWVGKVHAVQGDSAEVLWIGNSYPTLEKLKDLEITK